VTLGGVRQGGEGGEALSQTERQLFLRVSGDLMDGGPGGKHGIPHGAQVVVDTGQPVENGAVACVWLKSWEKAGLRRVYYHEDLVLLLCDNPKFGPEVAPASEVTFVGPVVEVRIPVGSTD